MKKTPLFFLFIFLLDRRAMKKTFLNTITPPNIKAELFKHQEIKRKMPFHSDSLRMTSRNQFRRQLGWTIKPWNNQTLKLNRKDYIHNLLTTQQRKQTDKETRETRRWESNREEQRNPPERKACGRNASTTLWFRMRSKLGVAKTWSLEEEVGWAWKHGKVRKT